MVTKRVRGANSPRAGGGRNEDAQQEQSEANTLDAPQIVFNPNLVAINEPGEPLVVIGTDEESQAIADTIMSQEEEAKLTADAEARFNKEVGERLRHVREVLGMTVTNVSDKLNVTRQTLSNYESGRTPLRASVIRELAELYEVSCDWILGERNDIEINVASGGRTLYMKEVSPTLYPVSVKTEEDKERWEEAKSAKAAEAARLEGVVF